MYKYLLMYFLVLSGTTGFSQAKKVKIKVDQPIECVRTEYKLVFNDDFDGRELDTSKWYTYYPYGPASKPDSCAFCRTHVTANIYRDENAIVENGVLRLKSEKVKGTWFGKEYDYTSGLINSKQVFTTYGKYEIRCKLPKGKQQWPAFWIFGWNTEIDIFEFTCKGPDKLEFSIHNWLTNYCTNKNPSKGAPCYSSQSKLIDFGIDFSTSFHTFSVEYEPHMIKFYIDNIMVRYVPKYYDLKGRPVNSCYIKPGEYLMEPSFPNYGEPVSVIASQSVCKKHKEKKPVFPNDMEVDYIKVFQKDIQAGLSSIDK
ncbi:MAG: glycoside hydrolase family 16 protein [Saprospiraceae bacterium]|nr:glycoside hydrolase family 16 protein [Saprospiraceae bacterium]